MALFDWLRPKTELYVEPGLVQRLERVERAVVDTELQVRKLGSQVGAVEVLVAELNKATKLIDAEWSEWFDKFRHMYARLAKRIKDAAAANVSDNGSESRQEPPGSTIPPPPSPGDGQRGSRFYGSGRRNY